MRELPSFLTPFHRMEDPHSHSSESPPLSCRGSSGGFRSSHGTIDMIFAARQIQEKCREQHQDLFLAFIDFTKTLDSVNREAIIMEDTSKVWLPTKIHYSTEAAP